MNLETYTVSFLLKIVTISGSIYFPFTKKKWWKYEGRIAGRLIEKHKLSG
jgi:hypothetical protein